jgi:hypothetical protein
MTIAGAHQGRETYESRGSLSPARANLRACEMPFSGATTSIDRTVKDQGA